MTRRTRFLMLGSMVLVAASLVGCGDDKEDNVRNFAVQVPCSEGGPCKVGDTGPAGGIVVLGGANPEVEMFEVAPVNGFGTFEEGRLMVGQFVFGGFDDWYLPSANMIETMFARADRFACGAETDCASAYAASGYWAMDPESGESVAMSFETGDWVEVDGASRYYVRPVRGFYMAQGDSEVTLLPPPEA